MIIWVKNLNNQMSISLEENNSKDCDAKPLERYLNLYFSLPRSKKGNILKIKELHRKYVYWEEKSDWVFIHDNTRRENRNTLHWQALKLGFLVGGKPEYWEMPVGTQSHKSSNYKPSAPRVIRGLQRKPCPQWRADDRLKRWRKCSR